MPRIGFLEDADDLMLRLSVHFADKVIAAFDRDVEKVNAVSGADDDIARCPSRPDRDIKHGIHNAPSMVLVFKEGSGCCDAHPDPED
jgi:hypothetical protein